MMNKSGVEIRHDLMEIYQAGVRRVRGLEAVKQFLEKSPLQQSVHVVAIGKAASSMTRGALAVHDKQIKDGLLITKHHHFEREITDDARFICIESDHPVPGECTLYAGKVLLDYLEEKAVAGATFLFLLSGGASSLVEVFVAGMTLEDLKQLNRNLLADGLDIGQMNQVRRALSQIKGGRLAQWLPGCTVLNLLISDVPGDDPAVVGSGLLTPMNATEDFSKYSSSVRNLLNKFERATRLDDACFAHIDTRIVACLDDAKTAAAEKADALGYEVVVMSAFLEGDAAKAGGNIARILQCERNKLFIWGGETFVSLPVHPGRGGRNQHLALASAIAMNSIQDIYLLSAGTDGSDGPTADAGALVDNETIRRGQQAGYDAPDCLQRADAGSFLEATGDLITTGPTGTNVMDLVIGFSRTK